MKVMAKVIPWIGIGLFLVVAHHTALHKPLWGDETFGIQHTVEGATPLSLIINGASGQGSPAPFYYLLLKMISSVQPLLEKLSIPPEVYWRWPSMLAVASIPFLLLRLSPIPYSAFIAVGGGFLILFSRLPFEYALEARPYALWFAESVLLIYGSLSQYRHWIWIPIMAFLAATATAAIFQLGIVLLALILSRFLLDQPIRFSRNTWLALSTGMTVALYYGMQAPGMMSYTDPAWGTWPEYFRIARSYAFPILASAALCYWNWKDRHPNGLCIALISLGWFLMSPLIFYITRQHGFFFSERQYIYWAAGILWISMEYARLLNSPAFKASLARRASALLLLALCMIRLDIHKIIGRLLLK